MQALNHVFLAGIGNSGADHWQRKWHERLPRSVWVEHGDWEHPDMDTWVAELQAAVWKLSGPMVIVAHSLGCLLASEWASRRHDPSMLGALLVAVPDPDGPNFPVQATGFDDTTAAKLPFPSLIVASRDDPYATLDYAEVSAKIWGSEFVDIGARGHINAASGLDDWPEGAGLLERFVARLTADTPSTPP